MKRCSACKVIKPLSDFNKNKSRVDGYSNDCKECHKIYRRNENSFRAWAAQTLNNHKRRGYTVNVTIDEVFNMAIITKTCKYCGKILSYEFGNKGTSRHYSPSLDRINNEHELNIDNIQIICYDCNATKRGRTHEEFIFYCKNLIMRLCK